MKCTKSLLCAAVALSLGVVQDAWAARHALVIGNSNYAGSPLKNPVNDARAMGGALAGLGFNVQKVENLRRNQIGTTINGFASRIEPGDDVVVFYAGHGVQVKGINYLPAVDAEINNEEDVPLNSLNLNNLLERLDESKAAVKVLFLDACRNNPYARSFRSGGAGLARVSMAPTGTLMHFATRPGSVAADGAGSNGLYTSELLKHIKTPDLPIESMLKRVAVGVLDVSQGNQEPWVEGSLRGEFYFANTQSIAPSVAVVDAPMAALLDKFRMAVIARDLNQVMQHARLSESSKSLLKKVFEGYREVQIELQQASLIPGTQQVRVEFTISQLVNNQGHAVTPGAAWQTFRVTASTDEAGNRYLLW